MADYKISRPVVKIPPAGRDQSGGTVVENQCRTGGAARGHLSAGQRRDLSPCSFDPHGADFHWPLAVWPSRELGFVQPLASPHANGHDFDLALRRGVAVDSRVLAMEGA